MDKWVIEQETRRLIGHVWANHRAYLGRATRNRLAVLEPAILAQALGYRFEEYPRLGQFGERGMRFEVAGLVDPPRQRICVSRHPPLAPAYRFTSAHEVAHALLHPNMPMHRDRPVEGWGAVTRHSAIEDEADFGGACLLMPRKLVREAFESSFGSTPFTFDEQTAFVVNGNDPESLLRPASWLDQALALASCRNYNNRSITPLHEVFGVSVTSMARRIEELKLIRR